MKNKLQMASEFDVELENNIRVHFKQQEKSKSVRWLMGFICVEGLRVALLLVCVRINSPEELIRAARGWPP